MTTSQIFTEAHRIAKKLQGHYIARMSFALKMAYKKARIIAKAFAIFCNTNLSDYGAYTDYSLANNFDYPVRLAYAISLKRNEKISDSFYEKMINKINNIDSFLHLI